MTLMFVPMPFRPDLVVVDEGVTLKAARAIEIAPERLLDPEKWEGAAPLLEIAGTVAARAGSARAGAGGPARGRGRCEGARRLRQRT